MKPHVVKWYAHCLNTDVSAFAIVVACLNQALAIILQFSTVGIAKTALMNGIVMRNIIRRTLKLRIGILNCIDKS